jgi:hypothetical protein
MIDHEKKYNELLRTLEEHVRTDPEFAASVDRAGVMLAAWQDAPAESYDIPFFLEDDL